MIKEVTALQLTPEMLAACIVYKAFSGDDTAQMLARRENMLVFLQLMHIIKIMVMIIGQSVLFQDQHTVLILPQQ